MKRLVLTLVLAILSGSVAAGVPSTGSTLLTSCEQAEDIARTPPGTLSGADIGQAESCVAFVVGVKSGVRIGEIIRAGEQSLICASPQVTVGQFMRVVLAWLRANPQRVHEASDILVATALRDAFPCPSR